MNKGDLRSSMNGNQIAHWLDKWEESYKKGLLSFWILLQLRIRPTYPFEMKNLIYDLSMGTISAEDNSIYRALRRFEEMGLVVSSLEATGQGPDRRYYQLTPDGIELLRAFIRRNILVFQSRLVSEKINQLLSEK